MKMVYSRKSETITCFFQFPDQTKQIASYFLAHLIHITTKVREGSACKPRASPLWAARLLSFLSPPVRRQVLSMRAKALLLLLAKMMPSC